MGNYAYIDGNNLNLGVKAMGWNLDFKKFRIYLREKYDVAVAYLFLGYVSTNQDLYSSLQKDGFVLIFKPTLPDRDGKIKGNIDADLVLGLMIDLKESNFDKAVVVTSDGDFHSLVKYLYDQGRLLWVISPYRKTCSVLLKKSAKEKIMFMDNLEQKLAYKRKGTA
jgi:uncharacterized LabA/DUF88 family protein